jgi:hypothetical protein
MRFSVVGMLLMMQHGCCYISSLTAVCGNARRRMHVSVARQAAISTAVRIMAWLRPPSDGACG